MTENTQVIDPVKNIMVKGVETPRIIDNGDGTFTWNLKRETADTLTRLLLASLLEGLASQRGGRGKPGSGLSDLLGGGKF
jgi:DNA/RNA endonuclease YhcR with UshA esterase domain